jgi:hypothetical protein
MLIIVVDKESWLEKGIAGQAARADILVELRHMAEVRGEVGPQPGIVNQPREREHISEIEIDFPGEAPLFEGFDPLENRFRPVVGHPVGVGGIQDQTGERGGMQERAVAKGLAGRLAVPVVADGKLAGERTEQRRGLGWKAVHNALVLRIGGGSALGAMKVADVVGHEPSHRCGEGHGGRGVERAMVSSASLSRFAAGITVPYSWVLTCGYSSPGSGLGASMTSPFSTGTTWR